MKYQNIILNIESRIKNGELSSGSKLPSVRVLAAELNCSKSTVLKAYDTLVSNRLAYSIDKTGYFLMNQPQNLLMSEHIDLSQYFLKPSLMNPNELQYIFNKMMVDQDLDELEVEGLFHFRDTLKRHYRKRKVFTTVHDIIISTTKQEALHLITSVVSKEQGSILVENPSDPEAIEFFRRKKNTVFIDWNEELDLNLLELYLIKNNVKLIYITPSHHLPKGNNLLLSERVKLLELCYHHNVYVIENIMFEELNSVVDSQSLYALDKHDIVFQLKSFEFVYSSKFKLCSIITPQNYSKAMIKYKSIFFGHTSYFEQAILDTYLNSKQCDDDLLDLHSNIHKKYSIAKEVIERFNDLKVACHYANNETYIFVEVPFDFNLETMIINLKKQNISIKNCHEYFAKEHLFKGFLISLSQLKQNDVSKSLSIIFNYIHDHQEEL